MALSPSQVAEFRQAAADLDAVTVQSMLALVAAGSGWQMVNELMAETPAVVNELLGVSALLGVTAYDLSRSQANARGRFSAIPAPELPSDRVQGMVRWALGPLFRNDALATPLADGEVSDLVARNLSAGAQRLVRAGERDTVLGNAGIDPAQPRYARLAQPGACDFCTMLAGRGAVYVTKQSAGIVGFAADGRVRERGQRRGPQKVGSAFHDHCKCMPVALFPGESIPTADEVGLAA